MECAHCRTDNPSSFRYCGACGQLLPATPCDACGFATSLPFTFCGNCGSTLDLAKGAQSEERKLATVLFADVVDFTTMAEDSDPEFMARAVDAAFRQLSDIVVAHGGTIDKYIGDSVMAVFGVPTAHDDDAERAVAAALAIEAADTGLGFSVGVNTGEVMVMAMGGGAVTVMGDAVNVAARLEKAANRGEVLVGPITVELTQARINYRERPPMALKGKRQPVEVRQAISLRTTPVLGESALTPLAGRAEELEFLLAQWRRVGSIRRAGVVLVTGDPGIGKTRLLDELVAKVGEQAFIVRSVYPPYGGVGGLRVGDDIVTQLGPSDDEAVQARVRSLAGDVDPTLRGFDAAALRQEQLWALRRLTEDRCAIRPVLLLIEDVHMASTGIELLTSVVARLADLPVLVIFAGRPEGRWLGSFPMASTVRLTPLSNVDAAALARGWNGGESVDDAVIRLSGGNPLFLRELLAFASQKHDAVLPRNLPVSLRAVLAARLDGLSSAERSALQDLAVMGDLATVEQLVSLGGPAATEGITALTNSGLVRHRPDGTLRITEPLLREVAYETLPLSSRTDRHLRVAEISVSPDERARHLAQASGHAPDDERLRERAANALAAAGVNALDSSRPTEGVALLKRAVDLGFREPNTLLRLADAWVNGNHREALAVLQLVPAESGDPRLVAERTLVLANALTDENPTAAFATFDEAAKRWRDLGDPVKEGWSHSNKAVALFMNGRMAEAEVELTEGLELFRSQGYRTGEMAATSFRALIRPDHPDVETWLHESLAYATEMGDRSRHLLALMSLSWHHFLRIRLGGPHEMVEAEAWITEAIAFATELGASGSLLQGLCLGANLARNTGRMSDAREAIAEARRVGPVESAGEQALLRAVAASIEPGGLFEEFTASDPFTSIAAVIQMESALFEGRFEEFVAAGHVPTRHNLGRLEAFVGFGSAAAGMCIIGRLDEAEALGHLAAHAAERSNAPTVSVAARAVLAECAWRRGDHSTAVGLAADANSRIPGGLAGALTKRTRAVMGDRQAEVDLRADADTLRAPGLMIGVVPGEVTYSR